MNMKKWLLTGACVSMLSVFAACSGDSENEDQNPVTPSDNPSLSSGEEQNPTSEATSATSDAGTKSEAASSSSRDIYSSAMTDTDAPQMACSEIMFNASDNSDLEWVEVYIAGGMDMAAMTDFDMHLSGAVHFTFPSEPLKKGEYIVVTNDLAEFKNAYPSFAGRVFQWDAEGKLINEGDVVNVKIAGEGDVSCAFSNEPPWPSLANGKGHSLVFKGGNAAQSVAWCASKTKGGNPGVGGDECVEASNTVRINEVMPNAAGADPWIELYNSGDTDVDVTGWTVFVKRRDEKLTVASGVVPAKGYLVLDAKTSFDNELVVSDQGGEIYLNGPAEGQESSIWMSAGQYSSGVRDLADGSVAQGPMTTPTPGAVNSAFKIGSVYISEIHYHPKDSDPINFEFMKIVNNTDAPVTLFNANLKKGWKIEGIGKTFDAKDVIPAKSTMILLPDTLRNASSQLLNDLKIDISVTPVSFYEGKLSNRGETIAIKEPYAVETLNMANEKIFYTWHDATLYSDCWPSVKQTDGYGFSLHREDITTMGYEEAAWKEAAPSLGN